MFYIEIRLSWNRNLSECKYRQRETFKKYTIKIKSWTSFCVFLVHLREFVYRTLKYQFVYITLKDQLVHITLKDQFVHKTLKYQFVHITLKYRAYTKENYFYASLLHDWTVHFSILVNMRVGEHFSKLSIFYKLNEKRFPLFIITEYSYARQKQNRTHWASEYYLILLGLSTADILCRY